MDNYSLVEPSKYYFGYDTPDGTVVFELDGKGFELTPRQAYEIGSDLQVGAFLAFHRHYLEHEEEDADA